ncbi:hypothetical protein HIM_05432 [Hirsutella minnesotensis 3608]|uniref:Uncharacterized protein n=1 Tax=Hirsutella minnesotensis 3608 TaxID=1043627 RepID=A0A0F7ZUP8_9HYPO|nr:hypothetical protein HIM_05432 [Hirsutella minnesotensis 3608]
MSALQAVIIPPSRFEEVKRKKDIIPAAFRVIVDLNDGFIPEGQPRHIVQTDQLRLNPWQWHRLSTKFWGEVIKEMPMMRPLMAPWKAPRSTIHHQYGGHSVECFTRFYRWLLVNHEWTHNKRRISYEENEHIQNALDHFHQQVTDNCDEKLIEKCRCPADSTCIERWQKLSGDHPAGLEYMINITTGLLLCELLGHFGPRVYFLVQASVAGPQIFKALDEVLEMDADPVPRSGKAKLSQKKWYSCFS